MSRKPVATRRKPVRLSGIPGLHCGWATLGARKSSAPAGTGAFALDRRRKYQRAAATTSTATASTATPMLASRPLDEPDTSGPGARELGRLDLEILADCDLEMLSMVLIERPSEAKKAMMLPCAQAAEMVLGPDPTHVSADERGTPGMALIGARAYAASRADTVDCRRDAGARGNRRPGELEERDEEHLGFWVRPGPARGGHGDPLARLHHQRGGDLRRKLGLHGLSNRAPPGKRVRHDVALEGGGPDGESGAGACCRHGENDRRRHRGSGRRAAKQRKRGLSASGPMAGKLIRACARAPTGDRSGGIRLWHGVEAELQGWLSYGALPEPERRPRRAQPGVGATRAGLSSLSRRTAR